MRKCKPSASSGIIASYLKKNHLIRRSWKLRWKPVSGSTETDLSRWIKEDPSLNDLHPCACLADRQNCGIGQRGNVWKSPLGGVWISAALPSFCMKGTPELFGMSMALALSERLESKDVEVKIKWPNDLMVYEKKIAGFLPRLFFRGKDIRLARIGIGLNVSNLVPEEGISLCHILERRFCKTEFWTAEVLVAIEKSIELLSNIESIKNEVKKRLWSDKFLDCNTGQSWVIEGINSTGGLRLTKGNESKILNRW